MSPAPPTTSSSSPPPTTTTIPLLHSLYIELIPSGSPNATISSLQKFLQVLRWVLSGAIEEADFKVLYLMWLRAGNETRNRQHLINQQQRDSTGSTFTTNTQLQQPKISFPQFCQIMKNWTPTQLDIMLGILTQECNEAILALGKHQSSDSDSPRASIFQNNAKLLANRHLCTTQWIETVERLFLLLDTQSIGCWDLDRILLFLLSLLSENDKKKLNATQLMIRALEFMNSVQVYDGLICLKNFKLFFLENGLNERTVESTTKCLEQEIALYNGMCSANRQELMAGESSSSSSPAGGDASLLKHSLMWNQACDWIVKRTASAYAQANRLRGFPWETLQHFLQNDSDSGRQHHMQHFFSEKHAQALSREFLEAMDGERIPNASQYQVHIEKCIINVLLLYKRILQRVIQVSAGGTSNADNSTGLVSRDTAQQLERLIYTLDDMPPRGGAGNNNREAPSSTQSFPNDQSRRVEEQAHSQSRLSHQQHPPSQQQTQGESTSPHGFGSRGRATMEVATEGGGAVSSVASVSSGPSRRSTAQHDAGRHRDSHSRFTANSRVKDEISELSSLDDDLSVVKLPFNMEKRIRNAEWKDIKYENVENFSYLPVRTGPSVPDWAKDHGVSSENPSVKEDFDYGQMQASTRRPQDNFGYNNLQTANMEQQQQYNDGATSREVSRPQSASSAAATGQSRHDLRNQEILNSALEAAANDEPIPTWVPDVAKKIIAELIEHKQRENNNGKDAETVPPTVHVNSVDLQNLLQQAQDTQSTFTENDTGNEKRENKVAPPKREESMTDNAPSQPPVEPSQQENVNVPSKPHEETKQVQKEPERKPKKPKKKRIQRPHSALSLRPGSLFSRKKRPNPKKTNSVPATVESTNKHPTPAEESPAVTNPASRKSLRHLVEHESLIEKEKGPSPERELFDHLSLDGGDGANEDLPFNGDITPASLKHMLALTRSQARSGTSSGSASNRSKQKRLRGGDSNSADANQAQNGANSARSPRPTRWSKPAPQDAPTQQQPSVRTHRTSGRVTSPRQNQAPAAMVSSPQGTGVGRGRQLAREDFASSSESLLEKQTTPVSPTTYTDPNSSKRVVQPIALSQVPGKRNDGRAVYKSAYPGAQGEAKEIQLPSLPKSYYKKLRQSRTQKSPSSATTTKQMSGGGANTTSEKRWRI